MQGIENLLSRIEIRASETAKNIGERHVIVGDINQKLLAFSYKKISIAWLGKILAKFSTSDLYALHSECSHANNYAALFWFKVKSK